ncbi:MAG: hypothetical protein NDI75_02240 [Candidatus Didemnitutus sp.]|nr:hypothetical protein [Opitutaceae bacterium]MCM2273606.1 hypothetical protein [Candidatus Didemnitutus sp.]
MNNGTQELTSAARGARTTTTGNELDPSKRELMKAEIRLAPDLLKIF